MKKEFNLLHDYVKENTPNICQIVVYKDDECVYSDEWNGYKKDDCTHIMSATKSVFSLLIGIAIDKGYIKSVDEKVLDFFPEYEVKRGEKTIQQVTIRHLLTMRAPYKCKGDPWTKVCTSPDWTKTSLDLLGGRKGFTGEFNYQTVCLHILTGILFRATGMITIDFANKFLFGPLGITPRDNFYAKSAQEHKHFTIDKLPKGTIWFADPTELGTPGYGLCMSATELAKIGLMCLHNGQFNGEQVVSAEWIEAMTKPMPVDGEWFRNMNYGYLWWIIHPDKSIYAALGNSGNVIYIDPQKNVVVAVASSFKPTVFDRVDFIEEHIMPLL